MLLGGRWVPCRWTRRRRRVCQWGACLWPLCPTERERERESESESDSTGGESLDCGQPKRESAEAAQSVGTVAREAARLFHLGQSHQTLSSRFRSVAAAATTEGQTCSGASEPTDERPWGAHHHGTVLAVRPMQHLSARLAILLLQQQQQSRPAKITEPSIVGDTFDE